MQAPGIASGPEIHDERGMECMRASGKLAAQVLAYAGTLVQVNLIISCAWWTYAVLTEPVISSSIYFAKSVGGQN